MLDLIQPTPARRSHPVFVGGFVAGTLDLAYICMLVHLLHGLGPAWIFRSIAAGWLGREAAFTGGTQVAWLGAASHYAIALCMASGYCFAAQRWRVLTRRPWLWGPLYGIVLYIGMNALIVPLSAAATPWRWHWIQLAHLTAHMLLVGLPCALATAHALRNDRS
jgi:hypothetical protein